MNRRAALGWVASGLAAGAAGCLGDALGGGEKTPTPPPDGRATRSLLPDPPEGWSRKTVRRVSTRAVDIEAGSSADYESDVKRAYTAEALRWHSASESRTQSEDRYADWKVGVTLGKFSFGADGPDEERCRTLLANSPVLTREYVDNHRV